MKKLILVASFFFLTVPAYAQFAGVAPGMSTTEEDGTPDTRCLIYKFANGNVTDNGDGTCSIADQGGAGAGDNVTVDSTAIDTTADLRSNGNVDFSVTDGGAGGPDNIDADFDTTELTGSTTWGAGAVQTWTFDAGASDPVVAISSGVINVSTGALQVAGSAVQTGTDDDVPESGDFGNANDLDAAGDVVDDSHNHVIGNIDNFQEEVEDDAGAMVSGNTETRISVTYDDSDGTIDFVVDDMNDDVPESGDFGNAADLEATGALSNDVVGAAEMADADHGDVSWSGGVASVEEVQNGAISEAADIDNDIVTHAQIADADQTDTKCIWFEDPTASDDFNSIWANKTANDFLITELWCESDQTVDFDLQVDDGSPADVSTVDVQCAAGEGEDTSLGGDTTLAAGEELDLAITSVANTPTWVSICWTGNWVD